MLSCRRPEHTNPATLHLAPTQIDFRPAISSPYTYPPRRVPTTLDDVTNFLVDFLHSAIVLVEPYHTNQAACLATQLLFPLFFLPQSFLPNPQTGYYPANSFNHDTASTGLIRKPRWDRLTVDGWAGSPVLQARLQSFDLGFPSSYVFNHGLFEFTSACHFCFNTVDFCFCLQGVFFFSHTL